MAVLRCQTVTKSAALACVLLISACTPPKPSVPALTPQTAAGLLQYNAKAKTWLVHVKKQNPACDYKLELPDQISHPTTIDLDRIVTCGGRPSPRELDASVSFVYDQAAGRWVISRFSS
jgi:hypothetical protein